MRVHLVGRKEVKLQPSLIRKMILAVHNCNQEDIWFLAIASLKGVLLI